MAELAGPDTTTEPRQPERSFLATGALLLLIASVFLLELIVAAGAYRPTHDQTPPWDLQLDLLVKLGANSRRLVFVDGEWWRMLTAPVLHAGPAHVVLNSLALWIVGPRLEGLVGPAWFLAIFTVSCVSGDLTSMQLNSPEAAGVGASGELMGLAAAALVVSARLKSGSSFSAALRWAALWAGLIPTLIFPIVYSGEVDQAAHLGGALSGLGLGLFLSCRRTAPEGLRPKSPSRQVQHRPKGDID